MALTKLDRIRQQEGRLILYALRQKWGVPADFYKMSVAPTANSIETGNKGVTRTKTHIPNLMTTSVDFIRKFEYDIGFLAANKNFTYGGFFEPGDRLAVLDGAYLAEGMDIDQKDYFVYGGRRYDIQRIEVFDHQVGWMLHLRHTKENKRYAIFEGYVYSHVTVEQTVEGELN